MTPQFQKRLVDTLCAEYEAAHPRRGFFHGGIWSEPFAKHVVETYESMLSFTGAVHLASVMEHTHFDGADMRERLTKFFDNEEWL